MNAYQNITDNIIKQLESGALPWVKPWSASPNGDRNAISGRGYNGINRLLLASSGFNSPLWATYNQWQEKGVQVQKGQKGTQIVLFKKLTKETTNEAGEKETSNFAMLRTFTVFNADQTNYKAPLVAAPAPFNAIEACEATIEASGALISHGGDKACYIPSMDAIALPNKTDFKSEGHYYATAFHELVHWTGAKCRLDRDLSGRFGAESYAFEELVAEMGAAFLCADHAIEAELRHAGYIESWLKVLKNDNKAIFKAAALAQKAADFINQSADAIEELNEEAA